MVNSFIKLFGESHNYERAGYSSMVIANFSEYLTTAQIEEIVNMSLSNDQIYNSWTAQKNLTVIFSKNKEKIFKEKVDQIKKALNIDF